MIMNKHDESKNLRSILNTPYITEVMLTLAHRVLRRAYFITVGKNIGVIKDIEVDLIQISINDMNKCTMNKFSELSDHDKRIFEELVVSLSLKGADKLAMEPDQMKAVIGYLYSHGIPEIYTQIHK